MDIMGYWSKLNAFRWSSVEVGKNCSLSHLAKSNLEKVFNNDFYTRRYFELTKRTCDLLHRHYSSLKSVSDQEMI